MTNLIEVTRIFNASIELVWQLWTDPELVKSWWGPKHFIAPMAEIDFREGGTSKVSMKAPEKMGGQEWFSLWHYEKIIPYKLIEFIQTLADKNGHDVEPISVGMPPDFPKKVRTIVTFSIINDNTTEMTIKEYAAFGTISNFAQIGLEQVMDKMILIFS